MKITQHARLLAREVITKACALYASGLGSEDLAETRDEIINERWPTRDRGGVSMSNRKTIAEVRAAIREFYEPSDLPERNA
jgi:hypothetical protein